MTEDMDTFGSWCPCSESLAQCDQRVVPHWFVNLFCSHYFPLTIQQMFERCQWLVLGVFFIFPPSQNVPRSFCSRAGITWTTRWEQTSLSDTVLKPSPVPVYTSAPANWASFYPRNPLGTSCLAASKMTWRTSLFASSNCTRDPRYERVFSPAVVRQFYIFYLFDFSCFGSRTPTSWTRLWRSWNKLIRRVAKDWSKSARRAALRDLFRVG